MKGKSCIPIERNILQYCDLASDEDMKMRLVAALLLQTKYELAVDKVIEVGKLLDDYLNKKLVIDHHFWKRSLASSTLSVPELKAELSRLIIILHGDQR